MTSNRRGKAAIRARQTATGVPYMVARRQVAGSIPVATSVREVAARVDISSPTARLEPSEVLPALGGNGSTERATDCADH